MKIFSKKSYLAGLTAGLVLLMGVGTANAALLNISGGGAIFTPGSNDVLPTGTQLQDLSLLSTNQANTKLEFFFWGSESGFNNTLNTASNTDTEVDNAPPAPLFPGLGTPLFSELQSPAGGVTLFFTSDGFGGSLIQGVNGGLNGNGSIAFAYLDSTGAISALATDIVLFALDDGGSIDDNHDDYIGYVRASVVPIPAAVWLFGSGLAGLIASARRKSTTAIQA